MVDVRSRKLAETKGISFGKLAASGLLSSTALLPAISAVAAAGLLLAPNAAYAQAAGGGAGGGLGGGAGGASNYNGGAGVAGSDGAAPGAGGGGGGAGVPGGSGGAGSTGAAGGAGSNTLGVPGGNGANSADVDGGGGGGGGGFSYNFGTAAVFNPNGTGVLAPGGDGGNGLGSGSGGGGGAGGGYFVTITVSSTTTSSNVTGGAGGKGGNGGLTGNGGNGGNGGDAYTIVQSGVTNFLAGASFTGGAGGNGGAGVVAGLGGSGGAGFVQIGGTFNNAGTLTGGTGGTGSVAGLGGAGLIANGITLSNTGTITGGLSGDFATRAYAIDFRGTNTVNAMGTTNGGIYLSAGSTTTLNPGAGFFDVDRLGGYGNIVLTSGTLTVGNNFLPPSAYQGTISGAGQLTKAGTSVQVLSGDQTYTGLTRILSGYLVVYDGSLAGSVINNAGFSVGGSTAAGSRIYGNLTNNDFTEIKGQIDGTVQNNQRFELLGNSTILGTFTQGYAGQLLDLKGYDLSVGGLGGGGTVNLRSGTLTSNVAAGTSIGFAGVMSGTGGFTKTGDGEQTISGVQTYTGLTTVSGGYLALYDATLSGSVVNNSRLGLDGSTGSGSRILGNLTNNNFAEIKGQIDGAVQNDGTINSRGLITVLGQFTQGNAGVLDLMNYEASLGSLAGGGTIKLGDGNLTVGTDNTDSTYSGTITGSSLSGFNKVGTGTLTLGGVNTFTGLTLVSGGTLSIASTGSLAGSVINDATFINAGTVGGGVTNNATFTNSGTVTGLVVNNSSLTSTGTLNGLTNNAGATAQISGTLNGTVNNSGTVTLTGSTSGIGAFVQTSTGLFDLDGNSVTIGSLAGAGQVNLGSGILTTGDDSSSTTFSGVIAGLGGLTKTGSGTFTLSGANTYTGLTTVSAGELVLTSTGSLAGAVRNDATFTNSGKVAGLFTNNATLTSTGELNGGLSNSLGATANIRGVLAGAVSNSGTITLTGTTTGIGAFSQTSTGVFNTGGFATSIGSLAGSGQVNIDAGLFTIGSDNTSTTFAGVIDGTAGVTKIGTGTLTLSGVNTYTGLTTVNGGTLALASTGSLAGAVRNNATFTNAGTVNGLFTNNGTLTSTGSLLGGLTTLAGSSATLRGTVNGAISNAGGITVNGNLSSNAALTNTAAGTVVVNAGATWSGLTGFTNSSTAAVGASVSGTLDVSGFVVNNASSTFSVLSGGTVIATGVTNRGTFNNAGTVTAPVSNISGSFTNTGTVNGRLSLTAGTVTNDTTGTWNGNFLVSGGGTATNNGNWANNTGTVSTVSNGLFENFGTLTGRGVSVTAATGTFANRSGGTVTLDAGQVLRATNGGLITNAGTVSGGADVSENAIIRNLSGGGWTGLVTVRGLGTFSNAGTVTGNGTIAATGLIENLTGGIWNGGITVSSGGELTNAGTINGNITNSGSFTSTGTVTGNLDNRLSGVTLLSGALNGNVTNAGTVTLTGTTTGINDFANATLSGLFDLASFDTTIGSLAGGGEVRLGSATLTINSGAGVARGFFGTISGSGGLTKTGPGEQTLTNAQTYTGLTRVDGGFLTVFNGSLAGDVLNNATFTLDSNGSSSSRLFGSLTNNLNALIKGQVDGAVQNDGRLISLGATTYLSRITQGTGGSFELAGFASSVGSLAGSGTVLLGATGALTTGTDNTSSTFDGAISGGGTLTKVGTGTFTLGGANTFTGLTTVSAGTLALSSTGSLAGAVRNDATFTNAGSVAGLVTNNGTLTSTGSLLGGLTQLAGSTGTVSGTLNGAINNAGGLTVNGNLSSNGALNITGTGTVGVNAGATWSGLTAIDNASTAATGLLIQGTLTTGGTLNNRSGATVQIAGTGTFTAGGITNAGRITNGGTVNSNATNTGTITNNGTWNGNVIERASTSTINNGTWNGRFQIELGGLVTNNGTWNNNSGSASTITAGLFENYGLLTGLGVDVTGASATLINRSGGTITLDSGALLRAQTSGVIFNSGIVNGGGSVASNGQINNFLGANWNGNIAVLTSGTLNNAGTVTGTVTNAGTVSSTGTITGSLVNQSGGLAELRGAMNGSVSNDGTVTLTGVTTGITTFTQTGTGIFNLGGFNTTIGSLSGAGTVNLGAGFLTTGGDNSSTTFSGVITGSGGLTKTGTGTFTLSGVNTYTGLTTVSAGTLVISSTGSIADGVLNDATFTNNGNVTGNITNNATLTTTGRVRGGLLNNAAGTAAISGQIDGAIDNYGVITSTGGTFLGRFTQFTGGTATFTGAASLGSLAGVGTVTITGTTLTVGGDNTDSTFSGVIGGTGNLAKTGTGIFTLTGANTYAGTTSIDTGGTLVIGGAAGALGGGSVTNNGQLVFNRTTDYTVANVIGGTGDLIQIGTGVVTLTGSNTYTGQTLIGPGTLIAANNNALGTAAGGTTVFAGGTLGLQGGITITGEALSLAGGGAGGSGALRNISGNNSLTGLITLAANARITSDAGLLTLGSIDKSAHILTITGAGDTRVNGVISSGRGLIKNGTGTLTFAGVNTYTGPTLIEAGTLQVLAGAEIAGNVDNLATFNNAGIVRGFLLNNTTGTATNSGSILGGVVNRNSFTSTGIIGTGLENDGTASIRGQLNGNVLNRGTITLTGTTTGIAIFDQTAAGTFNLGGFNTAVGTLVGAGTINTGGARLTAGSLNANSTFSGVIAGTGSLEKVGTGRLTLTGTNTYTGNTTITGGALQLGNGGTTGSILGNVVNNGMLIINRSDAYTFAGVISGNGMLAQIGTGTTTLTGANTYAGGTLITAGRLVGNTTSLQGAIQIDSPGVLEFAQGSAGTYAGSLLGAGRFDKTGSGLLTLSGNSSTYTGGTFVIGGELRVDGDLRRSVVTVQSGTTLSGVGIIGGLVAQSGSTIAPGTSPGTLSVNGNVSLAAGSNVVYEIAATAPWDRILATGTALLAGNATFINLSGANAYAFNSQYLLLQADGGRTGTFANTTGLPGFGIIYRPELVYTGTQVFLKFAPNLLANIVAPTPLTINQRAVVNFIDTAVTAGYNPQPLFNIYILPNAQLPGAFDQLSGEVYATTAGVGMEQERLFKEAVLGRIATTAADARKDPATAKRAGAWGQFFGGWGKGQSDGNAARFDSDRTGFITGVDFGGGNDTSSWRLGAFGMRVQSDVTISGRVSNGEVTQSGGGVYGAFNTGGFSLALGGYLTSVDLRAFRNIALPGFAETNVGVTDGDARQAFAEVSYTFGSTEKSYIRPFVNGTVGSFKLEALTETGGAAALSVSQQQYDTATITGGIDAAVKVGKSVRLGGTLAGRYQAGDIDPQARVALKAAPAVPFTVFGTQLDDIALAARVEASVELEKNLNISVGYTGLIGDSFTDHGARATVQVRF